MHSSVLVPIASLGHRSQTRHLIFGPMRIRSIECPLVSKGLRIILMTCNTRMSPQPWSKSSLWKEMAGASRALPIDHNTSRNQVLLQCLLPPAELGMGWSYRRISPWISPCYPYIDNLILYDTVYIFMTYHCRPNPEFSAVFGMLGGCNSKSNWRMRLSSVSPGRNTHQRPLKETTTGSSSLLTSLRKHGRWSRAGAPVLVPIDDLTSIWRNNWICLRIK